MAINTDSFTYSDGHLPAVSGGVWVQFQRNADNFIVHVVSGQITGEDYTAVAMYNVTYASENVYSQAKITVISDASAIINLRDSGESTCDFYGISGYDDSGTKTWELFEMTNASWGTIGSVNTALGISVNDVMKVQHEASDLIKGYCNGVEITGCSATDSTIGDAYTVGVLVFGNTSRLDDWEGGDLAAGGTTQSAAIKGFLSRRLVMPYDMNIKRRRLKRGDN